MIFDILLFIGYYIVADALYEEIYGKSQKIWDYGFEISAVSASLIFLENLETVIHMLIHSHDAGLIPAPVTVVGS